MSDNISSFNEIKVYGDNNKICIGSKDKFEPMLNWMKKKVELEIKGVGKRYAPNISQYSYLNKELKISDIFNFFDTNFIIKYLCQQINEINNTHKTNISGYSSFDNYKEEKYACFTKNDIANIDILKYFSEIISTFKKELIQRKLGASMYIRELQEDTSINTTYMIHNVEMDISMMQRKLDALQRLEKNLVSKKSILYQKSILLISGEALIGKTHLFCDTALKRINNNQPSLLFFGNKFDGTKPIITNIITLLGLAPISEDEFLDALNKWGEEYNTRTLIMIDAINETENPKIWQENIIKFCEQIKSYPNLALVMSVRDVEKNKIITPKNEEYIANEIVDVEHKGFEGIEIEAVRTFCEALEVEFPKVPIHTYRLFVNPGMLFLYIETIKNSTKKVDTSIINPLTIFKSYMDDLERKYYQKYMNEVDEEDEVVFEAIEEFISLGTQKDYLHFYLDYKEVKERLKPLHNKILEFLISEGVLNKLKQESGTKVYFTYQKFENFFIANYLLNNFEIHRDKIGDILFGYENNALVEAFFMQIPQKLGQEPFDLYPNILDEYELCELYFDSLVWRETRYFTDKTFEYIEKIQNDWEGISSKYLEVVLQLSSVPQHPLNILSFHQKLLDMTMLQRDYKWSIRIHNLFVDDKIVKRIINWAWDKKEDFEIENESLFLYGITLAWFLTSSNRELRDGTTKALVNLFTDKVDVFLSVLKSFEIVNDLYVLERLYAVGYGIVLRSHDKTGFFEIGKYLYKTVFNKNEVIEHILIRDYAKLTIEYINNIIIDLDIELNKILPPYGSSMPSVYPDLDEIEKYDFDFSNIIRSMRTGELTSYGDFGRYTFQSALLSFNKRDEFTAQDLSNYACKVIFEIYITNKELFKKIESEMKGISYQRNEHRVERIGKKYQWLAMFKVLAKVADNYQIRDHSSWDDKYLDYKGASALHIRDIDPTSILRGKTKNGIKWWYNTNNNFENPELTHKEWLSSKEKLLTLNEVINVSKDDKEYLVLDTFFSKSGNKEKEEYRNITYSVYAYIVKKEDFQDTLEWLKKQNFYGNDIAESNSISSIFLREYPHSKVYNEVDNYYYGQNSWDSGYGQKDEVLPHKVLLSSTEYLKENAGYDSSLKNTLQIKLPNKWLVNEMKLQQTLNDGEWCNQNGEIVFFDPSSNNDSILIVDKKLLLNFLDEHGYTIFWTLNGEKMMRETDSYSNNSTDFIGYGAISGYAYFDKEKFIEHIDIKLDNGRS